MNTIKIISVLLLPLLAVAGGIQMFDEPVEMSYGHSIAAPVKSGIAVNDVNRDGLADIVSLGGIWKQTSQENGLPVYSRNGRAAKLNTPYINLNDNGYADTVVIKDGRYQWFEDTNLKGAREFEYRGNLEFVYGGELIVPKGQSNVDYTLGDLDSDGLDDIVIVLTEYYSNTGNPETDETTGYIPQKYAGLGRGWRDGQWVFNEVLTTVLWHRNLGTKTHPKFSMGSPVKVGDFNMPLSFTSRGCSVRILDFNGNGKNDLFVHSADISYVYFNNGYDKHGFVKFDNGHRITYGSDYSIGHRKNAHLLVDSDGLINIIFSGGSVNYRAIQKDNSNPLEFTQIHQMLFQDPPMFLDIFAIANAVDYNGNGKLDMVVGYEKGNIWLFENISDTAMKHKWARPVEIQADGKPIMLDMHFNLQGPLEWLIGYSNPIVADWNLNGRLDIIAGCHGEVMYLFENVGTREQPVYSSKGVIKDKTAAEIKCGWRSRPAVADITGNGLPDLVFADQDGHLAICMRTKDYAGNLCLEQQQKLMSSDGYPLKVSNLGRESGRAKISIVDWDGDGRLDIITNCFKSSRREFVYFFKNAGDKDGKPFFEFRPHQIAVANHCETGKHTHYRMLEPADFNGDGNWEVVAGLDTGKIYYFPKARTISYDNVSAEYANPKTIPFRVAGQELGSLRQAAFRGENYPLKSGEKIFRNRDWVFNSLPQQLAGFSYSMVNFEDSFSICSKEGFVYLLVPEKDGPYRDCYFEFVVSKGFEPVNISPFILFGADDKNKVRVLKKYMREGQSIPLGSWAVPVFYEKNDKEKGL